MDAWAFAYDRPTVTGLLKNQPQDFQVQEQMDVVPVGEGEHIWLLIRKTKQNTDQVAKHLARFTHVAYRDVGYCGLKDFFAVTEQWYSIYLPQGDSPDWSLFEMPGVKILQHTRHSRKIKRGTHSANKFTIVIKGLNGEVGDLNARLALIARCGVPNYFGPQRFGRGANNVPQAIEMLQNNKRIKNRNLRSILISAARSWLFNTIVSARINQGSWQQLVTGEPANLDGSGSIFISGEEEDNARLVALDIHPTAPLWGQVNAQKVEAFAELHQWELRAIDDLRVIAQGLEDARIEYQRRPTRMRVHELNWQMDADDLILSFALQKGQFATSVLRELVTERTA